MRFDELTEVARFRARAEFAEWQFLLDFAAEKAAEFEAANEVGGPYAKFRHAAFVTRIAMQLRWKEWKVRARIREGRILRNEMPQVWEAFSIGDIDAEKASLIGAAANTLLDPVSRTKLERRATRYAQRHPASDLRKWLKLVVREIEPVDENTALYAREDRRVEVKHGDNGMSWLNAYIPTIAAEAITRRLSVGGSALEDDNETGPRTLDQRRSDVFVSWLTNNENLTPGQYHVDVAVSVKGTVVQAVDGTWSLPMAMFEDLLRTAKIREWDITESIESTARFATGRLRTLIEYRDGHCQVPGCARRAQSCDIDHRTAWPDGKTSTFNCWALCRHHHALKGHGLIEPVRQYDGWAWRFADGTILGGPAPPVSELISLFEWDPDFDFERPRRGSFSSARAEVRHA